MRRRNKECAAAISLWHQAAADRHTQENNKKIIQAMFKKILIMVLFVAPLSLAAQKFAHFDYATIMQAMPEFKKAQTEMEAIGKQYREELQNMEKEINTKIEKFQSEVTDKTPENIRNRRAQEIQDLQQRYQQAAQDNEHAFDEARQKKFQPITQKVMDAVNAIAKEGNYVYIVDKNASQQAGIVINEALSEDVTKRIAAKLGISAAALTAAPAAAAPAAAPAQGK